jgi:hypothetical protein
VGANVTQKKRSSARVVGGDDAVTVRAAARAAGSRCLLPAVVVVMALFAPSNIALVGWDDALTVQPLHCDRRLPSR